MTVDKWECLMAVSSVEYLGMLTAEMMVDEMAGLKELQMAGLMDMKKAG